MATTEKAAGKSVRKAATKKNSKVSASAHNSSPYCVEIEHAASNPLLPHSQYPTLSPTGDRFPESVYFMYETAGCTGRVTLPGGYFKGHPKRFHLPVHKNTGRSRIVTLDPNGAGVRSGRPIMWTHRMRKPHTKLGGPIIVDPPGGGGIIVG
jgi:hypothetical protein